MIYAEFVPLTCGESIAIFFSVGLISGVVLARLIWFDVLAKINKAKTSAGESSPPTP